MALSHTIQHVGSSIIQVSLANSPLGTGFVISKAGHAITALHVIKAGESFLAEDSKLGQMHLMFAGPNTDTGPVLMRAVFFGVSFTVIDRDEENDLALLKINVDDIAQLKFTSGVHPETVPTVAKLDPYRPSEGEQIAISGYPLSEPSLVTTAGYLASAWAFDSTHQHDRYLGDITANPGNSGGPVYRVKGGNVIGVLVEGRLTSSRDNQGLPVEGIRHSANISVIIPSAAVAALAEKNHLEI